MMLKLCELIATNVVFYEPKKNQSSVEERINFFRAYLPARAIWHRWLGYRMIRILLLYEVDARTLMILLILTYVLQCK